VLDADWHTQEDRWTEILTPKTHKHTQTWSHKHKHTTHTHTQNAAKHSQPSQTDSQSTDTQARLVKSIPTSEAISSKPST
jgi:hypothetical protein